MLHRAICVSLPALLLAGIASCGTQQITPTATTVDVIKSPNDQRSYRYLTLPNQLRVLLASDPAADKAAASLVALRGQNHDPEAFGGLAHFLEHMLFIGTEKYPDVDEYQHFIAANGGSSNAYTAADHTNYFFDIHPDYFREGLDRFAHFFIDPLLDPNYVEREKNAVHSEYQLQIKDDGWRSYAAWKAAMNPAHPGSRFHIGSLETLGDGVQDSLREFFHSNYSSDQMIMIAITNEPLDTMEAWITPIFSAIENRNIGPAAPMPNALSPANLPRVLTYQSLKNTRQVLYNFPVPPTTPFYRQKPALYVTNLLGHEGPGSLHKHLRDQGWIESLSAGVNRLDDQNAFISVNIGLTQAGAERTDEVTRALFTYISMLQGAPVERWRYAEQARMAELGFRFQESSSSTEFAYRTGPLLAQYPPADVLVAPYLMEQFDAELIGHYLSYLRPDNLLVEIVGPDMKTDRVDTWFDVPYAFTPFDPSLGKPDTQLSGLVLPKANAFIPDALSLLRNNDGDPQIIVDTPTTTLWLHQDTEFGTPRANIYLTLGVEGGLTDPDDIVLAQIYQRLLADARTELTYPAFLAGLSYGLSTSTDGFQLTLSGYNDKQTKLLNDVLQNFTTLPLNPEKFALHHAELVREWGNFTRERPYTQTLTSVGQLLIDEHWPPTELAQALQSKTVEDLARWQRQRLSALRIRGLVHGNIDPAGVKSIAHLTAKHLPLGKFPLHRPSVRTVTERLIMELPVDHEDASMVLYLQDPDPSFTMRARSALSVQLLRQSYFTSLRTKQQLGYVVALSSRTLQNRGGMTFVVQSPIASPAKLQQATKQFLQSQIEAMSALGQDEFEQSKVGLIARLTETDKNLNKRSQRYWSDLKLGVSSFDSARQLAAHIAKINKPEILAFLKVAADKIDTQSLLVFSRGKFSELPTQGSIIADIASFKRR